MGHLLNKYGWLSHSVLLIDYSWDIYIGNTEDSALRSLAVLYGQAFD